MPDDQNSTLTQSANRAFLSGARKFLARPNYAKEDPASPDASALVDFREVLAGFASPSFGNANMENIFPREMAQAYPSVEDEWKEVLYAATGGSSYGLNLAALAVADKGAPDYLYVIEDVLRQKTLIIGPPGVDEETQGKLAQNGFAYRAKNDRKTAALVNEFLMQGINYRAGEHGFLGQDPHAIVRIMMKSLRWICGADAEAASRATFGAEVVAQTGKPQIFTSILAPKPKKLNL
jgi:hypothetical protein